MNYKRVTVIGGGITGLSVASKLSQHGIKTDIIEKENFLGGKAVHFTCKAAEKCVKCGTCVVIKKINEVKNNENITIWTSSKVKTIKKNGDFSISIQTGANDIQNIKSDSICVAVGFNPFSPIHRPYGYGVFKNVITNLELEKYLKNSTNIFKPSNGQIPKKIAFIQCVGSRDSTIDHLWCSKVCCASALRMANLIKTRQNEIEITIFYIDIQTFGKNFEQFYKNIKTKLNFIRSIPSDISKTDNDCLKVIYYDHEKHEGIEGIFDLIVCSVGIEPNKDYNYLNDDGIFKAGTVQNPMSITESISDAQDKAYQIVKYLKDHIEDN